MPLPALKLFLQPSLVGVAAVTTRQRIDHQPCFLLGAELDELVGSALEPRDLFAQLAQSALVLVLPPRFGVPESEERARDVVEPRLHLLSEVTESGRSHDLSPQARRLNVECQPEA